MGEPQQIITRREAIERGLIRYYTGKPCHRGHVTERYTGSCNCCGCEVLRHADNREAALERFRKYYQKNRESERKRKRKYYRENKALYVAHAAARQRNTREYVAELTPDEQQQRIDLYKLRDQMNEQTEHTPVDPLYVEVEHIVPLSQAEPFGINPEHPSNLHLAYKKDNAAKGNNIPINVQEKVEENDDRSGNT